VSLGALLAGACDSSLARAALLDALIGQEEARFAALAAGGASPGAICRGLMGFWSAMGAALARSAGAPSPAGPYLQPEVWRPRAARRTRFVRGWLEGLPDRDPEGPLAVAAFVVGRGIFDLGLQLAVARQREERVADAAALLGHCIALTRSSPAE
jgi:hypothetical protein